MKKVGIITFSKKGGMLGMRLLSALRESGWQPEGFLIKRYQVRGMQPFDRLDTLTAALFGTKDMLVFIGSCGIAVRAISPHLKSKLTDPGVVVLDECGCYAISLLSGHIGGANAFTRQVAALVGAEPVITTATDRNGVFAVDEWARQNQLRIVTLTDIKEISSRLLAGEKIGFYSELPIRGSLPDGLVWVNASEAREQAGEQVSEVGVSDAIYAGIAVTYDTKNIFPFTCQLQPMDLVLGMGCKKGKTVYELQHFLTMVLKENGLSAGRIGRLCSISQKAEEDGLIQLAKQIQIPFETYTASELGALTGEFTASAFVDEQVGVDNVCERAAALGSGHGRKLFGKQSHEGMTAAIYQRQLTLSFETDIF